MPTCCQIVFGLSLSLSSLSSTVMAVEFKSGLQQSTLIELYTSEGCSSCPPAEAYLNSLKSHSLLWKSYFPLAFHVDYWDYLGWKDRFAKPQHRNRQQAYADLNQQRTIYTPGFFVNGAPWRRGILDRDPSLSRNETGILSVTLNHSQLTADYRPSRPHNERLILNVALVGMDLKTSIKAGENSGRHSAHEFVVLHQQSSVSSKAHWQLTLEKIDFSEAERLAVVAWIQTEKNPRPLQATGGYIVMD